MTRKMERQWSQVQGAEALEIDPVLVEAIQAMGGLGRLLEKRLEIQLDLKAASSVAQQQRQRLEQAKSNLARIDGAFFEVNDLLKESMLDA